jgi:hypothetical protein
VLPPSSSLTAHALPALLDGPFARRRPCGALLARFLLTDARPG